MISSFKYYIIKQKGKTWISYVRSSDIPNIDLYMDQVTTFMDKNFRKTTRYPGDDKIMTKTMINNYAKNDLLPPPVRKKYSREHILILIFIYYYKGILSISDIQTLLGPITEKFFHEDGEFDIQSIYEEVFQVGYDQIEALKQHVMTEYDRAMGTFGDAPEDSREFLKLFSFICFLRRPTRRRTIRKKNKMCEKRDKNLKLSDIGIIMIG